MYHSLLTELLDHIYSVQQTNNRVGRSEKKMKGHSFEIYFSDQPCKKTNVNPGISNPNPGTSNPNPDESNSTPIFLNPKLDPHSNQNFDADWFAK